MSFEDLDDFFEYEPITTCSHSEVVTTSGVTVCKNCSCEITILEHDNEWKSGNVRCHAKIPTKGDIKSIFVDCKISNGVVNKAMIAKTEEKYKMIVGENTVRGDKRKGIVAACLYHVYLEMGEIITPKDLQVMFDIKRDKISDGMYAYHQVFKESRTQNINSVALIMKTIKEVGISRPDAYEKILEIAKTIENRNVIINRSSPQSVAPALVYFYLCLNQDYKKLIDYDKQKFAEKVGLSEITLTRIVKKIAEIYEKNGITNFDLS
jgi:transcription initiation factor TFIIIB Brf1 subunit/transcription initiation factor TFIIB